MADKVAKIYFHGWNLYLVTIYVHAQHQITIKCRMATLSRVDMNLRVSTESELMIFLSG